MIVNLKVFFEKTFLTLFFMLFVLDFLTGANTGSILPRYFYQIGFSVFLIFLTLFIFIKFKEFFLYSLMSFLFFIFFIFNAFIDFFWLNDFSYEKILKNSYLFLWFLLISFGCYIENNKSQVIFNGNFYFFLYFSFFVSIYGFFYYKTQFDIDLSASIYSTLVFLPLLLLQKKSIAKNMSLFFLIVLVILSFKRGAILCLFLSMLVCWVISVLIKFNEKELIKNIIFLFSVIISSTILLYIVNFYFDNRLIERFSPEQLSDGSGRGSSNSSAIDYIKNINDPFVFMFGSKDYVIPDFLGHNDWLVYFLNTGFIICFLMLFIYLLMVLRVIKLIFLRNKLTYSYASLFVISILMSLYSTSFGPTFHPMLMMITLGVLEGQYKRLMKL